MHYKWIFVSAVILGAAFYMTGSDIASWLAALTAGPARYRIDMNEQLGTLLFVSLAALLIIALALLMMSLLRRRKK